MVLPAFPNGVCAGAGQGLGQRVPSTGVVCGWWSSSPFFTGVALHRMTFPAVVTRQSVSSETFEQWCGAANAWWGAPQPEERTEGEICASCIS